MQLLPNTWEEGITTSLSLIITQIKVEACYADLYFFLLMVQISRKIIQQFGSYIPLKFL